MGKDFDPRTIYSEKFSLSAIISILITHKLFCGTLSVRHSNHFPVTLCYTDVLSHLVVYLFGNHNNHYT